jgi:hypothetical protein
MEKQRITPSELRLLISIKRALKKVIIRTKNTEID